jgi:hypothetical protein
MHKQLAAAILIAFSFIVFNGNAVVADSVPLPCDNVCPAPCDNVYQTNSPGNYLCETSIFDSPLFENRLIGKKSKSRVQFYGWTLTGITANNHGATQTYGVNPNGSAYDFNNRRTDSGTLTRPGMDDTSGNTYMLQTEQPADWKVNQLWFGAKRDLDNHFGWGFQADCVYGTDVRYARNWSDRSFDYHWGSGDYFAGFPQLFGTVGTKDLFVKVGKFAGGFSYEGLAAPKEYFYSHANICYGRPLVSEGVMVDWHPSTKWMFTGSWMVGICNSFENPYGDNGFLGKATYNFTKDIALSYRTFYNDRGARNTTTNTGQIDCFNTLIFTWKLSKNWFYMGEVAFVDGKHYSAGGRTGSDAWGINNHLIRTFSEKFSVGFRGEFHHSHASTFDNRTVTGYIDSNGNTVLGGQGGDIWTFTAAAHYKINPKTTFRPEIRYDYADYNNGFRPFGGSNVNAQRKSDQLCGGVSLIVMF